MQERLVIAGLELVGADQEPIGILLDFVGDLAAWETVERRLRDLYAAVFVLSRESDDGLVLALSLLDIVANGVEV